MVTDKQKVLILGGGFGGIKAALELAGNSDFDVTLVSESDRFRFYPSLYHTATGGNPAGSTISLNEIFNGKAVKLAWDSAKKLDRKNKTVRCISAKKYRFD